MASATAIPTHARAEKTQQPADGLHNERPERLLSLGFGVTQINVQSSISPRKTCARAVRLPSVLVRRTVHEKKRGEQFDCAGLHSHYVLVRQLPESMYESQPIYKIGYSDNESRGFRVSTGPGPPGHHPWTRMSLKLVLP